MDSNREGFALEERVRQITSSLPETSFFRHYIQYASQLTDCNSVYHIGGALSLLTQSCPDDLHVRLGSKLFGNLYILIVGPSTDSRKTAAVKICREVLEEALPGRAAEAPGSHEGLVESLRAQPKQLIPYEEFGHFLSSSDHSYLTPIKTALTSIYDGSPAGRTLVNTKKRTLPPVQKPRLSLFVASAPDYLNRHTEPTDWTGGFFARFLALQAPRARDYDTTPNDNVQYREWLVTRLRSLASANGIPGAWEGYTPGAALLWREWSEERKALAKKRAHSRTAGAIGRSQAIALKVAMLLAWENADIGEAKWWLDEKHLRPAIDIVKIHLDSVLAIGENLGGTKDMNDRQAVLHSLNDRPKTLGEIVVTSYLLRRRVLELLESLQEEKTVIVVPVTNGAVTENAYTRAGGPHDMRHDARVIPLFHRPAVEPVFQASVSSVTLFPSTATPFDPSSRS